MGSEMCIRDRSGTLKPGSQDMWRRRLEFGGKRVRTALKECEETVLIASRSPPALSTENASSTAPPAVAVKSLSTLCDKGSWCDLARIPNSWEERGRTRRGGPKHQRRRRYACRRSGSCSEFVRRASSHKFGTRARSHHEPLSHRVEGDFTAMAGGAALDAFSVDKADGDILAIGTVSSHSLRAVLTRFPPNSRRRRRMPCDPGLSVPDS